MNSSRAPLGARSVLAGAERAGGERQVRRRRTTPLLVGRDPGPDGAETSPPKKAVARTAAKTAPAARAAAKTAPAAKSVATKSVATKSVAAKSGAKKAVAKEAVATPAAATKAVAKKAPATKATAKQAPAKQASAKQASAEKVVAEKPPLSSPGMRPAFRPAPPIGPAQPTERVFQAAAEAGTAITIDGDLPVGGTQSMAWAMIKQAGEALAEAFAEAVAGELGELELNEKVADLVGFVGRRLSGDYDLDEFGFDPEFTDRVWLTLLRPVYRRWFRVEVRGIENIPTEGGALIVANHSGSVPVDALMTAIAVRDETPGQRYLRVLAADLVFQLPFVSTMARQAGATLASNPDVERLLTGGELVGVWPEGFKGIGKPFTERYKLQRFGRGGFVSAALRTGAPIVPCSIVGAEEIYPIIGNVPSLARLLGVPYLPITPFFPWLGPLGMIPLPSKWLIEFSPPVPTDTYPSGAADDPMLVFDLTDQVRQSIQQTLYSLLVQRRSIFF